MTKRDLCWAAGCVVLLILGYVAGGKMAYKDATDEAYKKVKDLQMQVEVLEAKNKALDWSNDRLRGQIADPKTELNPPKK